MSGYLVGPDRPDPFKRELTVMLNAVSNLIAEASAALLSTSLAQAEEAVNMKDEVDDSRRRCISWLLKAEDFRSVQIVCATEAVSDLNRMAALAMHIATITRRRHPDSAVPEELKPQFETLSGDVMEMLSAARDLLEKPDTDAALSIIDRDDDVDAVAQDLFTRITQSQWPYSVQQAVDCSQITRFYERLADHCTNLAALVIYLLSGLTPEDYAAQHQGSKFSELKRFFRLS